MRLNFARTAAFGFAIALASPALAQKAPIDTARMTAARELLELSGAAKQFEAVLPMMMQQMTKMIVSQKPDKKAEIEQVMEAVVSKAIGRKSEVIDQLAVIYAERFTTEDIASLSAFYKSPVGKKLIEAQPDITRDSMAAGQKWGQKIGAEVMEQARQELKKRGVDL